MSDAKHPWGADGRRVERPEPTLRDAIVERGDRTADLGRLFTADEVIEIANETSDSFGNLYRLDFIDRIRHEAARRGDR